jgi:membrane-bound serine protease (ClpP class)
MAWFLPHIPYFNRLMLKPPSEMAGAGGASDLIRPETVALLGAVGVAETPLRPAGMVKFGDEFVDVLAEGDYIVPGTSVQVIQVEGNRIVVKAI